MIITLGESDSFLHGGKAEIIVIQVTLNSGKKMQFPFPAKYPIWKIYDAVSKISEENIVVPSTEKAISHVAEKVGEVVPLVYSSSTSSIGKEDLVRCTNLYPRGEGATVDLKVGDIYRVIKTVKNGFEVIDDKADTPRRLFVFNDEVIFHQKRKPPVPKTEGKKGKSGICPFCIVEMIYYKEDDGRFVGPCLVCNKESELIDERKGTSSDTEVEAVQSTTA